MLATIIIILFCIWILGFLVLPVFGGFIHLLLIIILILAIIRALSGGSFY